MVKVKNLTIDEFIEYFSKDFQFNPNHPYYCGFINIDPTRLGDPAFKEAAQKIITNPEIAEKTANKYGLTIEAAWSDEIIFTELSPRPRINHLY
jgi:hypothetical protein